jgi:hypothetical protein
MVIQAWDALALGVDVGNSFEQPAKYINPGPDPMIVNNPSNLRAMPQDPVRIVIIGAGCVELKHHLEETDSITVLVVSRQPLP